MSMGSWHCMQPGAGPLHVSMSSSTVETKELQCHHEARLWQPIVTHSWASEGEPLNSNSRSLFGKPQGATILTRVQLTMEVKSSSSSETATSGCLPMPAKQGRARHVRMPGGLARGQLPVRLLGDADWLMTPPQKQCRCPRFVLGRVQLSTPSAARMQGLVTSMGCLRSCTRAAGTDSSGVSSSEIGRLVSALPREVCAWPSLTVHKTHHHGLHHFVQVMVLMGWSGQCGCRPTRFGLTSVSLSPLFSRCELRRWWRKIGEIYTNFYSLWT